MDPRLESLNTLLVETFNAILKVEGAVSPPRHQGDRDGDGAPFAGCRCPG